MSLLSLSLSRRGRHCSLPRYGCYHNRRCCGHRCPPPFNRCSAQTHAPAFQICRERTPPCANPTAPKNSELMNSHQLPLINVTRVTRQTRQTQRQARQAARNLTQGAIAACNDTGKYTIAGKAGSITRCHKRSGKAKPASHDPSIKPEM